jgi:hypothetical protein
MDTNKHEKGFHLFSLCHFARLAFPWRAWQLFNSLPQKAHLSSRKKAQEGAKIQKL